MLRDYFIPHDGNDYRPHSIQRTALLLMSLLVLLTFVTTSLHSLLWVSSDWLVSTILPAVIVELTNEERQASTLGGLTRNPVLDIAATRKAQHMANEGYFSHYSPNGTSPWYWFADVEYAFLHAGENLAVHFSDSDAVVDAWMNSPTHRANILSGNYVEIGVGTARGEFQGYPTIFVVQLFGTPQRATAATATAAQPISPAVARTASSPSIEPAQVLAEAVTTVGPTAPAEPVAESFVATSIAPTAASEPAPVVSVDASSSPTPGWWEAMVRPQMVLQGLYALIASIVVVSLVFAVCIEIRRQQPLQLAYACLLLGLMSGLAYLQVALSAATVA